MRPAVIRPVVVQATFGADGKAIETEIAESSDPTLNTAALNYAKSFRFSVRAPPGATQAQSRVYLNVGVLSAH